MPDIRGCIDYLKNGCQHPEECERARVVMEGNPTELVTADYWPARDECNCRIILPTIQDERDAFAEQNKEDYQEAML